MSVPVSSAGLLSGMPDEVTVAVAVRVPVAAGSTVPVTVYTTDPPGPRLTVSLMLPSPPALPLEPGLNAADQETFARPAGSTSVTCTPLTPSDPLLVTVTVYRRVVPGTAVVWLSVLVIARSNGTDPRVSMSVKLTGWAVPPPNV